MVAPIPPFSSIGFLSQIFIFPFQHPLTFQTDEDLVEKFLSSCEKQEEPVDVIKLSGKVEPILPLQLMSHQLLCQHLIFKRDVFLHPNSLPEGSSDALLDPNFLQEGDPQVQHVSSLLSLVAKKATQGYKLLGEAEAFHLEAYSLVPKISDSVAKTLVMSDIPSALPGTSSGIPLSLKCSKSVDDTMLIPVSKIHCISTEELQIPEDFPEVWPEELDPSYIGLKSIL